MNILAIESSAVAAGCAVVRDDAVVADLRLNAGLTHSQTLMSLIDCAVGTVSMKPDEFDYIAVSCGPGSFTGVRIGVATAKGIAFAHDIPCVSVSTLEAAAAPFAGMSGYVCVLMDARRDQYYTAIFSLGDTVERISEDEALRDNDIAERLRALDGPVWLCADGCEKFYVLHREDIDNIRLVPESMRMQSGLGVALAAKRLIAAGKTVPADELMPVYLRLPQAERELIKKQEEGR